MPDPIDSTPGPASREQVIGEGITWLSRWTLRWVVLGVGAVLIGYAIQQMWIILLPLLLAMVLTTVLQFPAEWLERRWGVPRAAAAVTVILGALGAVALIVSVIAPSVGAQMGQLATSGSTGLNRIEEWAIANGLDITQAQVESMVDATQQRLQDSATTIANGLLIGVGAITSVLINLILTLVLSFYFLKDGHRFLPWLRRTAGPTAGTHLSEISARAWTTMGDFVRTQALVGLIDAVLIGLALVILGVPLAIPLAVLTFIAAFAPIVGAITVGVLAVLITLVANGWVAALIILAVVLVVQQLEGNVFLPWLQGRSLNLHAGIVLLTVVLGSALFGVAGAFLGVPLVAVAVMALRYLSEIVDEQTAEPDIPDEGEGSTEDSTEGEDASPPDRRPSN